MAGPRGTVQRARTTRHGLDTQGRVPAAARQLRVGAGGGARRAGGAAKHRGRSRRHAGSHDAQNAALERVDAALGALAVEPGLEQRAPLDGREHRDRAAAAERAAGGRGRQAHAADGVACGSAAPARRHGQRDARARAAHGAAVARQRRHGQRDARAGRLRPAHPAPLRRPRPARPARSDGLAAHGVWAGQGVCGAGGAAEVLCAMERRRAGPEAAVRCGRLPRGAPDARPGLPAQPPPARQNLRRQGSADPGHRGGRAGL